jgi:hypothetical protein
MENRTNLTFKKLRPQQKEIEYVNYLLWHNWLVVSAYNNSLQTKNAE